MGKSKSKISKVEQLFGKFPHALKQPQMYELAHEIEAYLYASNIFMVKESYSSSNEWRGNFEFIGSKYINTEQLNKLL